MNGLWRLIRCPPAPGDWNMALDELLLELAAAGAPPCLRLYAWNRPTLSLGYFQALEEIPSRERERYPVVRRMTGGGAILHDRELTYALAAPGTMFGGAALYEQVNRALLHALRLLGIEARERGPRTGVERAQRGCFFCFARPSATDIIVALPAAPHPVGGPPGPPGGEAGPRKLAGSAQRRRRGGLLQHGSILLQADEPQAVGVLDLVAAPQDGSPQAAFDALAAAVVQGFQKEFGANFQERELSAEELARAQQIRRSRYADLKWLQSGSREGER